MESSKLKKQGILTVIGAVAIQMTIGVAYIWSVFQTGIAQSIFDGNNAAAALTFSILLAALTLTTGFAGKLSAKYTIRKVVFIGGIILGIGFFLASFVTAATPWALWLTYGVMGGIGMGFTYSTTIACAQKWYPHKKGFVTGIILSALGLGGVVFTPVIEWLIATFGGQGIGESNTFMVLAIIFFIMCTIGSIFMKNPPDGYMTGKVAANPASRPAERDFTPKEMLKTPHFYLVTFTFLFAVMGGLMMIAFARPIADARELGLATIAVLSIAVFNTIGRLVWGAVSDKIGFNNTILVLLIISATLSLLVNAVPDYWLYVLLAGIGFAYGGILSTFAALTSHLFGAKHMATNYGIVLLGFGAGAIVSSQIAGYFMDVADRSGIQYMFPAFVIASAAAAAGVVMMIILKKMKKPGRKGVA